MQLNKYIDHTLLKPEATEEQILTLIEQAKQYDFASVCVNPTWVPLAARELHGTDVKVCTVIGFPLGATMKEVKAFETKCAIEAGATEIDMVINVGAAKDGNWELVYEDIKAVVDAANGTFEHNHQTQEATRSSVNQTVDKLLNIDDMYAVNVASTRA